MRINDYITVGGHASSKEQAKYCVWQLVRCLESLVEILTLGFLTSKVSAKLLFSRWVEK